MRPSGVAAIACASWSEPTYPMARAPSVSEGPGMIALTRMPRGPNSLAATMVKALTALLDAT